MPKAKIKFKYDKKTGKYEIIFDMEQETLDLREHDRIHDKEFVKKIVGDKLKIYKEDELKGEKEPPKNVEEEPEEEKKVKV